MIPGNLQLPTIWIGCDWQPIILKWKDANGDPFDLTLWAPKATTRTGISLNAVVIDPTGGVTMISLPRSTTAIMKLGVEQWDWVWSFVGEPTAVYPPILSGNIQVAQSNVRTLPIS